MSAILGSLPTTLLNGTSLFSANTRITGVDLSALGSGKTLVDQNVDASDQEILFTDCKLGSSVAIGNELTARFGDIIVRAINCDSGDTNYRYYLSMYEGTVRSESTIVRTSGATDGTTSISRKMVSGANTKFYAPLRSDWMLFWDNGNLLQRRSSGHP